MLVGANIILCLIDHFLFTGLYRFYLPSQPKHFCSPPAQNHVPVDTLLPGKSPVILPLINSFMKINLVFIQTDADTNLVLFSDKKYKTIFYNLIKQIAIK